VCDEKFEDERGLEGKTEKIDSGKGGNLEKIHHRHRRIVMNEILFSS
jgi:hypothetical protein